MLLWLSSLTFHAIIIISISLNCFIANIFFSHGVWSFFCGNFIVNLITRLPYIFHIRARHINFRWLFCVGIEVNEKCLKSFPEDLFSEDFEIIWWHSGILNWRGEEFLWNAIVGNLSCIIILGDFLSDLPLFIFQCLKEQISP